MIRLEHGIVVMLVIGCAGTGVRPHDMSVAGHHSAAEQEDRAAAGHAQTGRDPGTPLPKAGNSSGSPWSPSEHPSESQRHRELAAEHHRAAAALVDAERLACAGVSEVDRDTSPFADKGQVLSVVALRTTVVFGRYPQEKAVVGAKIVLRPRAGMTVEWLQQLVSCHVARAAALGHDMSNMDQCPLVLDGIRARVSSVQDAFYVSISSEDPDTAREILRRAEAMSARGRERWLPTSHR